MFRSARNNHKTYKAQCLRETSGIYCLRITDRGGAGSENNVFCLNIVK